MEQVVFNKKRIYNGNIAIDGRVMLTDNAQCNDINHLREFLKNICASEVEEGKKAVYMIFDKNGIVDSEIIKY